MGDDGRALDDMGGLAGIGEGSFHRWGTRLNNICADGTNILTLNWKFSALGVMTVISWAVDALCRAFAPGLAKETLPTNTL